MTLIGYPAKIVCVPMCSALSHSFIMNLSAMDLVLIFYQCFVQNINIEAKTLPFMPESDLINQAPPNSFEDNSLHITLGMELCP